MALLTINDIMNKHIEEDTEVLTLNIEKMGGDIKVKVPSVFDLQEIKLANGDNYSTIADIIIFENCIEPKINNDILIEKYNCKQDPKKVVGKIFGDKIKLQILEKIMDEATDEEMVKKVVDTKN